MATQARATPLIVSAREIGRFRTLLEAIHAESGHDPALVTDALMDSYRQRIEKRALVVVAAVLDAHFIGYAAMEARSQEGARRAFVLLSVLRAHWSKGVGSLLTRAVIQLARRAGEPALYLEVAETNARARTLYERFGFSYVEPFRLTPPHAVPHALMRLELESTG